MKTTVILAEGGRIGGTIGEHYKSISHGDDDSVRGTRPDGKNEREAAPYSRHKPAISLAGRWRSSQQCNTGRFEIALNLGQT